MTYIYLPIGLTIAWVLYLLYVLLVKKDSKQFRAMALIGLVFVVIWAGLYIALLR